MAKLKTYVVQGYLTISVRKELRARNVAEARRKAESLSAPGLCDQCASAGEGSTGEWELNGFDLVSIEELDDG